MDSNTLKIAAVIVIILYVIKGHVGIGDFRLGELPGDLMIRGRNFTFFAPITSGLLLYFCWNFLKGFLR